MKEELLIQYFYEELLPIEKQMLDASAGGALVDKTPVAAKILIANPALNAQQYEGVGGRDPPRHQQQVNERMKDGKVQMSWAIKAKISHGMIHTLIPIIRAGEITQTSSEGSLNNLNNKDDIDNHFPGSIKGHSYHDNFQHNLPNQAQGLQNQAKEVGKLKKQMGQMTEFMGQFQEQGNLPSSTLINPNRGFETANAITLRSGKQVGTDPQPSKSSQNEDEKLLLEEEEKVKPTARVEKPLSQPPKASKLSTTGKVVPNLTHSNPIPPNLPFPRKFMQVRNEDDEKDILETFRNVQVNIPLLDAIKQIPKYAKFFNKLCTTRKQISEKEVIHENSAPIKKDEFRTTNVEGIGVEHKEHATTLKIHNLAESTPCLSVDSVITSLQHIGKPPPPIPIHISTNRLLPCKVQVPNRIQAGGNNYIDFWKLNAKIRKDYYPLPFIEPNQDLF
ncbi:uncharacterized protein LOC126622501 [Malus sylvestris]|uniref:uncharacterized protein LOC126622501 n=1 Tax=Malus sylvestris TaxID=3752 RepID=UPI0021AD419A|nr:uncharacterized protein LOC126622501 [Malus sylvestris]